VRGLIVGSSGKEQLKEIIEELNIHEETGTDFNVELLSKTITNMAERGDVETFKELETDFFHTKLSGFEC
jgi:hypothetical protein